MIYDREVRGMASTKVRLRALVEFKMQKQLFEQGYSTRGPDWYQTCGFHFMMYDGE